MTIFASQPMLNKKEARRILRSSSSPTWRAVYVLLGPTLPRNSNENASRNYFLPLWSQLAATRLWYCYGDGHKEFAGLNAMARSLAPPTLLPVGSELGLQSER